MKKAAVIMTLLFVTLVTIGCKQQEQKQQQVNYTPANPPVLMEIDQMQQATRVSPKDPQAWINLGNTLMDAQRFGEAVDAYEKALVLEPKNVNLLVDLGTCYRGVGKFDKAVGMYRTALKINPSFPNGHLNLGVVLGFDLHNKAEGIKELKRFLELIPNGPQADSAKQAIQELSAGKTAGR
jgi:cytochrome c-type biogenesis protein CcmH/NrfG